MAAKHLYHQNESSNQRRGVFFQPKLEINQPDDLYEKEADEVAEKVIQSKSIQQTETFFKPVAISSIQRKCAECENEEKLQRSEENTNQPEINQDFENYVEGLNNSGSPLPSTSKSVFESRIGYDFSNVKIHTDSVAAKSAQSINALAYTSGNNIVFNQNQFQPGTTNGDKLIAHELTHVVQQNNLVSTKRIQKSSGSSKGGSSGSGGGGGGAAPVPTGDCRIDVRATHIGALGGAPVYHLFVILHNKTTGDEFYYRGGPAGSGPYGNIITEHGPYVAGSIDWAPGAPTVTVQDPVDCSTADTCLSKELSRIDGTATPYQPTGPNSNTVARTLLHNCGFTESKPVWIAPGWGDPYL